MGWPLICSHLVNKEPDLNTSSCSFWKFPQRMAWENKEKLCRAEETVRNTWECRTWLIKILGHGVTKTATLSTWEVF